MAMAGAFDFDGAAGPVLLEGARGRPLPSFASDGCAQQPAMTIRCDVDDVVPRIGELILSERVSLSSGGLEAPREYVGDEMNSIDDLSASSSPREIFEELWRNGLPVVVDILAAVRASVSDATPRHVVVERW
eukprot:Opistho-1_new@25692